MWLYVTVQYEFAAKSPVFNRTILHIIKHILVNVPAILVPLTL